MGLFRLGKRSDRQRRGEFHLLDHQLDKGPEKGQRETRWFNPSDAVDLVDDVAPPNPLSLLPIPDPKPDWPSVDGAISE